MKTATFYCRTICLYFFLIVSIHSFVFAQNHPFVIKGKINTAKAQDMAMLWYPDPTNIGGVKDSVKIKNGMFAFHGSSKLPGKAILYTKPDYNVLEFIIESGTIRIQSNDSLVNATVTGGPYNKDFNELLKELGPINKKRIETYRQYDIARKALPENADKNEFEKSWEQKKQLVSAERKKALTDFIRQMPDSPVSIEAMQYIGGTAPDAKELNILFESLTGSVQNSPSGIAYKKVLTKLTQTSIGATAPNFAQTDTSGKLISLSDFRGKYVFLDFWASWCAPCRAEHPALVKTYNEFSNRNFTVLSVSLDQSKNKLAWLKAIAKDGLTWTQVSDLKGWANEAASIYNVQAIPKNYLIGPDGTIIATDLKAEVLKEKLDLILDK
jgi:peroxiredoxin